MDKSDINNELLKLLDKKYVGPTQRQSDANSQYKGKYIQESIASNVHTRPASPKTVKILQKKSNNESQLRYSPQLTKEKLKLLGGQQNQHSRMSQSSYSQFSRNLSQITTSTQRRIIKKGLNGKNLDNESVYSGKAQSTYKSDFNRIQDHTRNVSDQQNKEQYLRNLQNEQYEQQLRLLERNIQNQNQNQKLPKLKNKNTQSLQLPEPAPENEIRQQTEPTPTERLIKSIKAYEARKSEQKKGKGDEQNEEQENQNQEDNQENEDKIEGMDDEESECIKRLIQEYYEKQREQQQKEEDDILNYINAPQKNSNSNSTSKPVTSNGAKKTPENKSDNQSQGSGGTSYMFKNVPSHFDDAELIDFIYMNSNVFDVENIEKFKQERKKVDFKPLKMKWFSSYKKDFNDLNSVSGATKSSKLTFLSSNQLGSDIFQFSPTPYGMSSTMKNDYLHIPQKKQEIVDFTHRLKQNPFQKMTSYKETYIDYQDSFAKNVKRDNEITTHKKMPMVTKESSNQTYGKFDKIQPQQMQQQKRGLFEKYPQITDTKRPPSNEALLSQYPKAKMDYLQSSNRHFHADPRECFEDTIRMSKASSGIYKKPDQGKLAPSYSGQFKSLKQQDFHDKTKDKYQELPYRLKEALIKKIINKPELLQQFQNYSQTQRSKNKDYMYQNDQILEKSNQPYPQRV